MASKEHETNRGGARLERRTPTKTRKPRRPLTQRERTIRIAMIVVAALAALAHDMGKNVWTYTGYTWETLSAAGRPDWDALLAQTDVLVDGPFVEALKSYSATFRGSSNQRLIDLAATRRDGAVRTLPERE